MQVPGCHVPLVAHACYCLVYTDYGGLSHARFPIHAIMTIQQVRQRIGMRSLAWKSLPQT